ncbi:MAG: chorismate synthase [Bacteroidales bacterium]
MNTFGKIFRISIFGESHGTAIGITLDGIKPGLPLSIEDFSADLLRRKSGARGTTPRLEDDTPEIVAGWFNGYTTGAPLTVLFRNVNTKSGDYERIKNLSRPGHADFVANKKFSGYNDYRGGGHFSGRLTLALVAAGVIAKKIVAPIGIAARLISVGGSSNTNETIDSTLEKGDSVGGVVECRANGIPVGLGEPFFDSVESLISHLAFSIPAIKGIEFGSGFAAAGMTGSQHNDRYIDASGKTSTNNAGGISGGITNGNELVFRVAVKPTSSISQAQQTVNTATGMVESLEIKGRHDACIALRVPVVLEAITAIALADLMLVARGISG